MKPSFRSGGGGETGGAESGPVPGACCGTVQLSLSREHSRAEEADGGSGSSRYVALVPVVVYNIRTPYSTDRGSEGRKFIAGVCTII